MNKNPFENAVENAQAGAKWPLTETWIRHARSAYNSLKDRRRDTPLYQNFLEHFYKWELKLGETVPERLLQLAAMVQQRFALNTGDHDTLLDEEAAQQAYEMAANLSKESELPDIIAISPYFRTKETFRYMKEGWPALATVPFYFEERIRELDHGLAIVYNDWKVFTVFHPEQQLLHDLQGPYWYKFPQGENVPDVRDRNWRYGDKRIRDFGGKHVMNISHHLNILAERANRENWDAEQFIQCDNEDKPINCGVTRYRFDPDAGQNGQGKLVLDYYNRCFYA